MSKDVKSVIDEFHKVVNMTPKELESWLGTDESKSVGQKDGDDESIGHKSGRQIIQLLQKKDDYTDDDLSHMKKVTSYVHRHSAQQPSGDVEHTRAALLSEKLGTRSTQVNCLKLKCDRV